MKILMIGGSGIISSEICNLAIQNGNEVSIFNRGRRKEEINPTAKLIIGDIRNDDSKKISDRLEPMYDVVIDFISYTPEQLKKTLEITAARCKQFVFVSSATAYSPSEDIPYDENSLLGNSYWKYAQNKADCESYITNVDLQCDYTIIRPYITYGHTRIPYQIAPIEYYTIINRIKCRKPIAISGKDTRCTLTTAKDFAVGAYGLLLNSKAYGEAFHVTGDYTTTWENVIQILADKIEEPLELIDIPMQYIKKHRRDCGFDVDEILGDKGRDMLFDNSKLKAIVPEFQSFRSFEEAIDDSLSYFKENLHQIVNYKWDAELDRFLEKYTREYSIGVEKRSLSVKAYENTISEDERHIYRINRNKVFQFFNKVFNKISGGKRK